MHYARWRRTGDPTVTLPMGPKPHDPKRCSVDGCDKPSSSRGWCRMHYMRWRRTGDPLTARPKGRQRTAPVEVRQCEVCGADFTFTASPSRRPGTGRYCSTLCSNRADKPRRRRRGSEHPNWKGGHVDKHGYRLVYINGKLTPEHRHVMSQTLGRDLEPHETVHHKNGDRLDNRPENLELWKGRHPKGQRDAHCPTCTCFDHH